MMSNDSMVQLLILLAGIIGIIVIILIFVWIVIRLKEKNAEKEKMEEEKEKTQVKKSQIVYTPESIINFMDFEKIEDNMIIQKKGKFLMVVECQGINYDLMSQAEKVAVEEGFVQFLNTLSHPIQIYTQTRKINLESSLQTYKAEVDKVEQEYQRQTLRYRQIMQSPNATEEQRKKALYEYTKQKNLYEYGKDIIYNTEKMSLNKNILNKKYYIVIPYYVEEVGDYGKEELREIAFSELYTRAQSIIRTLSTCGVLGKVMSSTELVDLLYVAYNRDESDVYGVDKAIKAGYNELYSTAPDYMDKKMKILDEQITKEAMNLANEKVIEAQTEKQKEYEKKVTAKEDIINNLAQLIIEQNEAMLGKDIAEKSKEKVRREKKA